MLWIISGIIVSYIIGSIPTAYICGRLLKGIDIRKFGSGNVGATNALRILGKPAGITVLALDILKGFLVVFLWGDFIISRNMYAYAELLRITLGLSCICGHIWTIFLKFKGGKGVATTFGVLLALSMKIAAIRLVVFMSIATWVVSFLLTHIVSLSSVITAVSLPLYMLLFRQSYTLIFFALLLSVFIILRHKSNLIRIFHKQEKKLF